MPIGSHLVNVLWGHAEKIRYLAHAHCLSSRFQNLDDSHLPSIKRTSNQSSSSIDFHMLERLVRPPKTTSASTAETRSCCSIASNTFNKLPAEFSPRSLPNRHRGSGHPLAPATPPDMRVRIGRFRGLRWTVEQGRKSKRCEVSIG